jgi:predicted RNA binding protein YcfA (HicA-like mRNA interferase family)
MRNGCRVKRQSGSHRVLGRAGFEDYVFAFHDQEEIGPRMLARIAKRTGLAPGDLFQLLFRAQIMRSLSSSR